MRVRVATRRLLVAALLGGCSALTVFKLIPVYLRCMQTLAGEAIALVLVLAPACVASIDQVLALRVLIARVRRTACACSVIQGSLEDYSLRFGFMSTYR